MDLSLLEWIDKVIGADNVAVRDKAYRLSLLFTQQCAVDVVVAIVKWSYLDEIERYVAKVLTPLFDEFRQAECVLRRMIAHIAAALIEQDSLDRAVLDRRECSVAPHQCALIIVLAVLDYRLRVDFLVGIFLKILGIQPALNS